MAVQKHSSKTSGKAGERSSAKSSEKAQAKSSGKAVKGASKFDSLKSLFTGSTKKSATSPKTDGKLEKAGKKADKKADHPDRKDESVSKSSGKSKQAVSAKPSAKAATPSSSKSPGKSTTAKSKSGSGSAALPAGRNSSTMLNGLKKSSASLSASPAMGRHALDTAEAVCREVACEGLATTGGYCRLHYIKNWKKIKRKEVILREKKLNQYIEELVAKYPDKYIEAIRQDLVSDKDFAKVIYDLDLDEGVEDFDMEGGESVDSLIDSIKRDFDDETDAF